MPLPRLMCIGHHLLKLLGTEIIVQPLQDSLAGPVLNAHTPGHMSDQFPADIDVKYEVCLILVNLVFPHIVIEKLAKVALVQVIVTTDYKQPIVNTQQRIILRRDVELRHTAPQAAEYEEKRKNTSEFVPMGLIVSDEANGIEWLKLQLKEPKTYQEISPEWMQAVNGLRKGDLLPELRDILEENFIEDETGHWHVPDLEKQIDLEKLKHKSLMKEFNHYKEMAQKPRARIKEVRTEALREGFKQCFKDKEFATILLVGDKIPQNILTEDEVLLQYYDIAQMRS